MWSWTRYIRVLSTPSSPDLLKMTARGHVYIAVQNALVISFRFWSSDPKFRYATNILFIIDNVVIIPSFQVKGAWSFQSVKSGADQKPFNDFRRWSLPDYLFVIYMYFHLEYTLSLGSFTLIQE